MERKRTTSVKSPESQVASEVADPITDVMSVAQIQRLVRLLDRSDVSELEIKRADEGIHLVLRKVKAQDGAAPVGEVVSVSSSENGGLDGAQPGGAKQQAITAPLVGVFHPWLKPRGGTLVAVGDRVKAGQLVATIESLNVLNEVETSVAGRVLEIHAQDGQPVEYGQVLVTIELVDLEEV